MSERAPAVSPPSSNLTTARRWTWFAAFALPCVLGPFWSSLIVWAPEHFVTSLSGMVLVCLLVVSAVTDFRERKIFNWATYPALFWGLTLNIYASATGNVAETGTSSLLANSEIGIGGSLLGALACFAPMVFLRQMTGGGAGDVKLATAIGALVGVEAGLKIILHCYIIGGACILIGLIWSVGPITVGASILRRIGARLFPDLVEAPTEEQSSLLRRRVALGPYFAAATIVVLAGWDESWTFLF